MFKSDFSGKVSPPRVSPVKIIVGKRKKTYENYDYKTKKLKVSVGWEIVKEIQVLPEEAKLVKGAD